MAAQPPLQFSNAQETAPSTRCAVLAAASAILLDSPFGTNAALIFSVRANIDIVVEHFCRVRRPSLLTAKGKVIIGFDLGMDWDER